MKLSKKNLQSLFNTVWLLFVCGLAIKGLHKIYLESVGVPNGDAQWVYLPGGQKFLKDPWAFLTTDELSYTVAPLGYLWTAVWGVHENAIILANCALFLACIYLVWRMAKRLGGTVAAMLATALWVSTHTLLHAIPKVLTEAMFLFGFMLFLCGMVEAIASAAPRKRWFAMAGAGLCITLLSRPVLQYIVLGLLAAMGLCYLVWRMRGRPALAPLVRVIFRRTLITFGLALILPALVIIKNGIYFQNWGIGTGAGAGLYYGVHPLHVGEEPYYANFQYDIGVTASTIDPNTQGNLSIDADRWEKQIAVEMIRRTSLEDNLRFFAGKARSWMLYSPVERHFDSEFRAKRQAQLLLILGAAAVLGVVALRRGAKGVIQTLSRHASSDEPETRSAQARGVLFCLAALVLLTLAMVTQFVPVLYNSRYNGAFLDPLFVVLGSVAVALLTSHFRLPQRKVQTGAWTWNWRGVVWQVALIAVLVYVHVGALAWAKRHERLVVDPHRLGPAELHIDSDAFGHSTAVGMQAAGEDVWVTRELKTQLVIPLTIPAGTPVGKAGFMEGVWRVRLAVSDNIPHSCRDVRLSYSNADDHYSPLPTSIFLSRDGAMRSYALSGGFSMRPKGSGNLQLEFNCPIGTEIRWGGADYWRSTIAEASRDLIHNGVPFQPYQRSHPRLPGEVWQ